MVLRKFLGDPQLLYNVSLSSLRGNESFAGTAGL